MTDDGIERHLHHVRLKRRYAIGSWVIGISYMKELGAYLAEADEIHIAINQVNESAKHFLGLVRDEEFRAIRHQLTEIEPESNAHIARLRMGIVGKTQMNSLGNKYFTLNKDFIIAAYYHEDGEVRQKIDAEINIAEMIEPESQQFVDFYLSRSKVQLETVGQDVRLPDLISDARQDIEYWLSQGT